MTPVEHIAGAEYPEGTYYDLWSASRTKTPLTRAFADCYSLSEDYALERRPVYVIVRYNPMRRRVRS